MQVIDNSRCTTEEAEEKAREEEKQKAEQQQLAEIGNWAAVNFV